MTSDEEQEDEQEEWEEAEEEEGKEEEADREVGTEDLEPDGEEEVENEPHSIDSMISFLQNLKRMGSKIH